MRYLAVFNKIICAAHIYSAVSGVFNGAARKLAVFSRHGYGGAPCALQGQVANGYVCRLFSDVYYVFRLVETFGFQDA